MFPEGPRGLFDSVSLRDVFGYKGALVRWAQMPCAKALLLSVLRFSRHKTLSCAGVMALALPGQGQPKRRLVSVEVSAL